MTVSYNIFNTRFTDNLNMRFIHSVILFFYVCALAAAAPLEKEYAATLSSISNGEKDFAFAEARHCVITAAIKYIGTPYRYSGISSSGLDCSGLVYVSFRDALGISAPRSTSALYSWVESVSLDKAQPGDLLFFKTDRSSDNITHVAIYLGGRRFIHAASEGSRTGVILTSLDEGSWSRTYAGAGRVFPEAAQVYLPFLLESGLSAK